MELLKSTISTGPLEIFQRRFKYLLKLLKYRGSLTDEQLDILEMVNYRRAERFHRSRRPRLALETNRYLWLLIAIKIDQIKQGTAHRAVVKYLTRAVDLGSFIGLLQLFRIDKLYCIEYCQGILSSNNDQAKKLVYKLLSLLDQKYLLEAIQLGSYRAVKMYLELLETPQRQIWFDQHYNQLSLKTLGKLYYCQRRLYIQVPERLVLQTDNIKTKLTLLSTEHCHDIFYQIITRNPQSRTLCKALQLYPDQLNYTMTPDYRIFRNFLHCPKLSNCVNCDYLTKLTNTCRTAETSCINDIYQFLQQVEQLFPGCFDGALLWLVISIVRLQDQYS